MIQYFFLIRLANNPLPPEWKKCGQHIRGPEHIKDEFPEAGPNEETPPHCLIGTKVVRLPDVDLTEEDLVFDELGQRQVVLGFDPSRPKDRMQQVDEFLSGGRRHEKGPKGKGPENGEHAGVRV